MPAVANSLIEQPTPVPVIARQAILDSEKTIVGYELFNRSRNCTAPHSSNLLMAFCSLLHTDAQDLPGTKPLFLTCSHECLASEQLAQLPSERLVLDIAPLRQATNQEVTAHVHILEKLRDRGFKLAFSHTVLETEYHAWLPLADYIRLDLSVLRPEQMAVLVNYASRHSHAKLIASKVETLEQFNLLRVLGVGLFQGAALSRPVALEAKLLAPQQTSLLQLISLLRRQASVDELEAVLKKDVGLAFNLLRLINSAGYGSQREITSFRQAVMFMGVKKLFRWAALLLAATQFGDNPPALGQTAVARARLMELLALRFMGEEDADLAFVTGLFSMLDAMLSLPMPQALALIHAPEPVTDALHLQRGTYHHLLQIARACEPEGGALAHPEAKHLWQHPLPLSPDDINHAHLQALAWCDLVAA